MGVVGDATASSKRNGKSAGATLTARKLLGTKSHDIGMSMRRVLRDFGLKVGPTALRTFAGRIRELIGRGYQAVNGGRPATRGATRSSVLDRLLMGVRVPRPEKRVQIGCVLVPLWTATEDSGSARAIQHIASVRAN